MLLSGEKWAYGKSKQLSRDLQPGAPVVTAYEIHADGRVDQCQRQKDWGVGAYFPHGNTSAIARDSLHSS
jgi:hypothetical protein